MGNMETGKSLSNSSNFIPHNDDEVLTVTSMISENKDQFLTCEMKAMKLEQMEIIFSSCPNSPVTFVETEKQNKRNTFLFNQA